VGGRFVSVMPASRSLPFLAAIAFSTQTWAQEAPPAANEAVRKIMETYAGRGTLADDTPPTEPAEAVKQFQLRPDLAIDLMAAEPDVVQPLYASWDSKGRMWVTQYIQYQFPAGLKIVSYDQHLRAQFDKVPPPPPRGVKGADKITVLEDSNGDGFFDKHTDVITGLNIASAALHGMGRIWVLNPPYLLSYPDADGDGLPDGDPEVELSGFGLEDTHSVATSLTWGLDGWLYGANGSTTTGNVSSANSKNVRWEGQCVWRYHPRRKIFEVYAEGGGNTFSLEIDSKGRVFSGTNNGKTRGMHYEQGSYGIKGWGKHGPLTNPYAFGWFEHMAHEGDEKRFPQAFTIYEGGLLGSAYEGRILAPNSLANLVYVSDVAQRGSTFRTRDAEPLLTSPDRWFRPVWSGVGPDGGFYMADWYDTRLSHVRPVDDWHKTSGRIYRVRPASGAPKLEPFDLSTADPAALTGLLSHPNKWFRKQAVLEIGWRGLEELIPRLKAMPMTLEVLWALDALDAADPLPFDHEDAHVRRWAVKIAGERGGDGSPELAGLAKSESSLEVRAQLLASARRLDAARALPLLWAGTAEDESGHLGLLAWWALESKAGADRAAVFEFLAADSEFLKTALFRDALAERLAKRYALAGSREDFEACARLLALQVDEPVKQRFLAGISTAFEGGELPELPDALAAALREHLASQTGGDLTLALRSGDQSAVKQAITLLGDKEAGNAARIAVARTLSELGKTEAMPAMLAVLNGTGSASLKRGVLQAAARFDDLRLPQAILGGYEGKFAGDQALREDAWRALASRKDWAVLLARAVKDFKLPPRHAPLDVVRQLAAHDDPEIQQVIQAHWLAVLAGGPSEEKEREMERIRSVLAADSAGDHEKGKLQFAARCAVCHKLFGEGGDIGPDLTGYERGNLTFWLENIFNPSLEIREGYGAYIARLKSGQVLTGIIDAQDAAGVVLKDMAGNRHPVRQADLDSLEASPLSMMPESLTTGMSDADLRDFFSYLMREL
jgi:putative heme-binding domain-containing protein